MLKILRRSTLLVLAVLLPLYAVSLAERLQVPAVWRQIAVGDTHTQVRARLRESGLDDTQCVWIDGLHSVRCTLMGRHHACGIAVRFDGGGSAARVTGVTIRGPIYTGPFHLHARLRG